MQYDFVGLSDDNFPASSCDIATKKHPDQNTRL